MSSIILHELFDSSDIRCSKQLDVRNGQEELAEFVRREMESRNWSTYDVVRESGGLIKSNSTVWNVLNSQGKEVKHRIIQGLAKAFKRSEEEVFNIYRGRPTEPLSPTDFLSALEVLGVENFHAFGGLGKLTAEDQQEIIAMIEAMIEQKLKRRQKKK